MNLATFCDKWSLKLPVLMPFGHNFFNVGIVRHFVATHHPPPSTSISPCGIIEINYLKWQAIQLNVHCELIQ